MRITRDTLLKTARDTALLRSRADRHLLCIYLTGSLLREEPLLGGTTDIDLIFVHDDQPATAREMVRLSEDVHLDIAHYSQTVFHQPRHLRADPWLGSFLCSNPVRLHDVQHWFEFTQASVCAQFGQPETVIERARPQADEARQIWLELQEHSEAEASPQRVLHYLKALERASNAIACLSGAPLTERRFLLEFPERAEAIGHPGLAGGLVDLMTSEPISEESWASWLPAWQQALKAVGAHSNCPPHLNPCRFNYYLRAVTTLYADEPAAALWILLRTWTAAICCLGKDPTPRHAWLKTAQSLGLEGAAFPGRLEALDAYLDNVEETLDDWAAQFGI